MGWRGLAQANGVGLGIALGFDLGEDGGGTRDEGLGNGEANHAVDALGRGVGEDETTRRRRLRAEGAEVMKILFLGANPLDTERLRIHAELRKVEEELERAAKAETIKIIPKLAVRPEDLSRLLLDAKPDIVHFSGHGTIRVEHAAKSGTTRDFGPSPGQTPEEKPPEACIVLENNEGNAVHVPPEALVELFGILKTQRCIVLNACLSATQAKALTLHVDCVIGMKRRIGDESAIAFAAGFYQALMRGESVKKAFDLGKAQIGICRLPHADLPELHTKEGVDADTVRFVNVVETRSAPPPNDPNLLLPLPTRTPPRPLRKYLVSALLGWTVTAAVILIISIAWPLQIPSAPEEKQRIVVVGPGGEGRRLAESLCTALDATANNEPRAVCRGRGIGDNDGTVRKKAVDANVSVLVLVDEQGLARLYPLGKLAEGDTLGQGLPRVDLAKPGAINALAPVLRELARAANGAQGKDFDTKRLRCGLSVAEEPFGVALAILLLRLDVPNCSTSPKDIDGLRPRCQDEECTTLLDLLSKSVGCQRTKDPRVEWVCLSDKAFNACEYGDTEAARKWLAFFDTVPNPYYRLTASELAACLVAHGRGLSSDKKKALVSRADKPTPECKAPACSELPELCNSCTRTFARRGMYWGEAGDWKRAEENYEFAAYESRKNEDLLGLVESRLHRLKAYEMAELGSRINGELNLMRNTTPKDGIRAALLRWVFQKRAGNTTYISSKEDSLLEAYGKLEDGKSVYAMNRRDKAAWGLLCSSSAPKCPVYELLAVEKSAGTAGELRKALQEAKLPEE